MASILYVVQHYVHVDIPWEFFCQNSIKKFIIFLLITRLFEICSTSLVALIRNFPLFCNFPLRFCNFPMSMSTNDVEQISNNRVINQESHVYFVKFGINLTRSFFLIFKSPPLCPGRFQKFQKTNSVNLSKISLITM